MITTAVVEARRILAEAQAIHTAATEKVQVIEQRIAQCRQRQQQITAARLEGEASAADAAEFAALQGDVETLANMLAAAQTEARAAASPVDDAHRRLAFAESEARRDLAQAEFDALHAKAAELDRALCQIVAHLHQIGRARLGHVVLSQSWRPSQELERAMRLGVAPPGL